MRLRRRKRRRVPGINTASIADISFTLLILFLVVTSMDDDKGLTRMLPKMATEQPEPAVATERNVLQVELGKGDVLLINGEKTDLSRLQDRVKVFVDNPDNLPNLPEKHKVHIEPLGDCLVTESHVIRLKSHLPWFVSGAISQNATKMSELQYALIILRKCRKTIPCRKEGNHEV